MVYRSKMNSRSVNDLNKSPKVLPNPPPKFLPVEINTIEVLKNNRENFTSNDKQSMSPEEKHKLNNVGKPQESY
jgi:hypothetical protein